jgi:hypothetical protein
MLQRWLQAAGAGTPSTALAEVTAAFVAYEANKSQRVLEALAAKLKTWRINGPLKERYEFADIANDLEGFITVQRMTNLVINATAQDVGANEYYELIKPTPDNIIRQLGGELTTDLVGAFTGSDIQLMNEAFRRARQAASGACDQLRALAPKLRTVNRQFSAQTTFTTAGLPEPPAGTAKNLFVKYFGPWDHQRFTDVLTNFECIRNAFDTKIMLYDVRNTQDGRDWYAACFNGKVAVDPSSNRVTNRVKMVIGRDFFTKGKAKIARHVVFNPQAVYSSTSDATIGTIIHEMAHGSFYAVDAPIVLPGTPPTWSATPNLTAGDHYGESPDKANNQSSTPADDELLASAFPNVAIRNADNYGQFARQLAA